MNKIFEDNETVFIKTYCFESGLWYLAKSLGDMLEKQGHKVYYIPKSKYKMLGANYERIYLTPNNYSDFKDIKILQMANSQSIDKQLGNYIVKYNAKYIISFETLMRKANWINIIKTRFRNKIKVIDVPMPEWVEKRYIESSSYNIFDQIWCLNNLSINIFKDYKQKRSISWNYVDQSIFNAKDKLIEDRKIKFLHIASTNPDYSTKNTELTIEAFDRFMTKYKPTIECSLHIQGSISNKCKIDVSKSKYITHSSNLISRKDLAALYKKHNCIIAVSSQEGLSLSLYEAKACDCDVITTDNPPMNYIDNVYLCKVKHTKQGKDLVPLSVIDQDDLIKAINDYYEMFKNKSIII